ncbi:hypothetical protein FHR24_002057 [Wenyingzhuangia heitensis]|uniref:Uncharacterized protein n=1 Tax=Wenyingzhuangia heitensis TaxID=1487859 RepID=A0ABX0U9S5_9FLAO|nr:glycoside hydrolase family protein [Wenyingzhuangia heitensis]NIJ45589.1 hypothetical protein [Wenyingzhuangia heitensis]
MKIKTLGVLLLGIVLTISCKEVPQKAELKDYQNISFEPLSTQVVTKFFNHQTASQVVAETGYYVWGLSVVKWEGEYHAYYSRWKKEYEHKGWMTNCEIAHAVAKNPEGPFVFKNVVLESKKVGGWDVNNSHNPYAVVADGKVCLYYIANDIKELLAKDIPETQEPTTLWYDAHRTEIRDSQRIGVAIATNPAGPFVRSKHIVVAPDDVKFKKIAVNPAVIYKDKEYLMIMKGDDLQHKKPFRIQLVGNAKNPEGPFNFYEKPVYAKAQTEDACMWFDKILNKHFMVCHVMGKSELALFSSTNGFDWQPDERKIFMKKEFLLSNGTIWKPKRVERPFVLTNNDGQPIMIYVAVYDKNVNGNIAIPISWKSNKN